ncbi:hypothetical protein MCOR27_009319 [Pyricularia oryzae]|uniref:C2H2-type domain-containing protein n=2 Tax=Pyricularia TaxID=48558 RepID=A0ABQ8N2J0_PYRGI|nr:hypothetical protein MCOR01_000471 [Pyricularia oryzae]KAI6290148.1 hypothetical protein MCOR33_011483 [Pyricularia grisea]KAH9428641.1 hypothetical protein MCOR02_011187 [Pyricularia oryzae]KAI6251949.1 hypothetical protein MCOR19_011425 [Pyricularia oryzae]KAI6264191.1 hypothetical protein MCOR26_011517 [Pyricularia oryzae]
MSYSSDYYNDSSGTQDANAEWFEQQPEYQTSGYTNYNAQQDPVQCNTDGVAEASDYPQYNGSHLTNDVNPSPTYNGSFVEERFNSLDGLDPRSDDRFYCEDSEYGPSGCAASCKNISSLRKHLKSHTRPVLCPYVSKGTCQHRTAEQRDMRRHVVSHHSLWAMLNGIKSDVYDCSQCRIKFTRHDNWLRHVREQHAQDV